MRLRRHKPTVPPTEASPSSKFGTVFTYFQRVGIVLSCVTASVGLGAHGVAYWRAQTAKAVQGELIVRRLTAVEVIANDCEAKLTHLDDRYVPKAVLDEREKHIDDLSRQIQHVETTLEDMNEALARLATMQTRIVASQVQNQHR